MRRSTEWLLRDATFSERVNWDMYLTENPDNGNILQTAQFAAIKEGQGWQTRYMMYETPYGTVAALVLARYIFPLGYLWYFPKGPGIKDSDDLTDLLSATKDFIGQNNLRVFVIKIEPEICKSEGIAERIQHAGFLPSHFIQPNESTIVLEVYPHPEEQTAHLGRRARRYIRRAERENVKVRQMPATPENFKQMYSLMQSAYGGQGIPGLHPYEYYENFWRNYINEGAGRLYFGFEDDTPTVGVFVVLLGNKAVYKDGGSRAAREAKGTAYFIHWYIMNDLSKEGIMQYDLWGAPPRDQVEDTGHPLWGVGNFKTAFSKDVIDYVGVLDGAIRLKRYLIWQKILYPAIRIYSRLTHTTFW